MYQSKKPCHHSTALNFRALEHLKIVIVEVFQQMT